MTILARSFAAVSLIIVTTQVSAEPPGASAGTSFPGDLEKVRIALNADPATGKNAIEFAKSPALLPLPTAALADRIAPDGRFKRVDPRPKSEDLIDTIASLVYVFSEGNTPSGLKDKIYTSLDYWLDHYPAFHWTVSAMSEPAALGWVLLKMHDAFEGDKNGPYKGLLEDIRRRSLEYIRYSWSNGKECATFMTPSLGDNPSLDWQRMGNLGYRLAGYTSIIAATGDNASMDTLSILVSNQFSYKINRPGAPAVAALYDGSLQQHGPQIYNMGYGGDWLNLMGSYAGWVKGTRWQITPAQQSFWATMLLNGMQWMTWNGYTAHNIVGRHSAQKGELKRSIEGLLDKYLFAADIHTTAYDEVLKLQSDVHLNRCLTDSTKYFWDSDVTLVHAPSYFASIRMLSDRVVGSESSDYGTANDNFYLSDGSMLVYPRGTQYDNARVGWDWRCVPGTTVKQKTGTLPLVPWSHGYESDNRIAGGVCDGHVSVSVFDLSRVHPYARTKACKAYFTFPGLLLCMGNSIKDDDPAPGSVYTTVDQTERRTAIYYGTEGARVTSIPLGRDADTVFKADKPTWFWQDSMGYVILPSGEMPTTVVLKAGIRTGNWHDLDTRNPDVPVQVNMFQLSIDHGSSQTGWKETAYRYAVVPSIGRKEMERFFKEKVLGSLQVQCNSDSLISASYGPYTGLIFLRPTETCDKPAAVLLQRTSDRINVSVGDITNSFGPDNMVKMIINHAIVTADLSKKDSIQVGEPVHLVVPLKQTTHE